MADKIRDYANSVLMNTNQATLTDEEALNLPNAYNEKDIFNAVLSIMNTRGATGNGFKKVKALALLRGFDLSTKQKKRSDILIGMVLE